MILKFIEFKNGLPPGTSESKPSFTSANIEVNEMTSKDYYFDSYAHFGIHEGNHNRVNFLI